MKKLAMCCICQNETTNWERLGYFPICMECVDKQIKLKKKGYEYSNCCCTLVKSSEISYRSNMMRLCNVCFEKEQEKDRKLIERNNRSNWYARHPQ